MQQKVYTNNTEATRNTQSLGGKPFKSSEILSSQLFARKTTFVVINIVLTAFEPHREKTGFYLCENKGTNQLISAFVFITQIVQSSFFLNPKNQGSSLLLCLYRSVCVRPSGKPKFLVFLCKGSSDEMLPWKGLDIKHAYSLIASTAKVDWPCTKNA